jgi:hypothetical protein
MSIEISSLIGLSETEVESLLFDNSILFRVIEKDGHKFMLTANYDPLRLNLVVKKGIVIKVTKG